MQSLGFRCPDLYFCKNQKNKPWTRSIDLQIPLSVNEKGASIMESPYNMNLENLEKYLICL